MTSIFETPTYCAVRRYPDGETWMDETQAGQTILEAMRDLDHLHQVVLIEGGRVIDMSGHACEEYWKEHGHEYKNVFEVEPFLHEHFHNQCYADISEWNNSARCEQAHIQTLGPR